MSNLDRRSFLQQAAAGAVLASTGRALPGTRGEADLAAIARSFRQTAHDEVFSRAVGWLQQGATWQELLGGAFLAGVHDVKPRPVGFKFHCVMMVESAFQLADATTPGNRLLPVFYNIDDFKRGQEADARLEGDWELPAPPDTSGLPAARAAAAFRGAMDDWHDGRADVAITRLSRSMPRDTLFELLWPYGARSFQNIGHNIIFTAHVYRTLRRIGWKWREPALRSLVHGILDGGVTADDLTFDPNKRLVAQMRQDLARGEADPAASRALLASLRRISPADAAEACVDLSNRGVAASSIWDGQRLLAAELMVRAPGIVALHATTVLNAMHFAYRTARRDATRKLLLLQGASWVVRFRQLLERREGSPHTTRIDEIGPEPGRASPQEVFEAADSDRAAAMRLVVAHARDADWRRKFCEASRRQVFTKAREHHMYKYPAAVLEDTGFVHERWAPHYLAAAMSWLPGARQRAARVYRYTREALRRRKL